MFELDRDFKFEITEEIGVVSKHSTGWQLEVNLISWNGGKPKYDLRDWSPDHEYMSKGITLSEVEMSQVIRLMLDRTKAIDPLQEKTAEAEEHQKQQSSINQTQGAVMKMNGFDREIRFEIVEQIGVISTHSTGWNKELNLVSWNNGQPKFDLRDWDSDHTHMSRGITLTEAEMQQVMNLMLSREKNKSSLQDRIAEAKEQQEQQQQAPQKENEQTVDR